MKYYTIRICAVTIFFVCLVGGPLDIMNRRVLCAGTKTLALQIAKSIQQMEYERD